MMKLNDAVRALGVGAVCVTTVAMMVRGGMAGAAGYEFHPPVMSGAMRILPQGPVAGVTLTPAPFKDGEAVHALVCTDACSLQRVALRVKPVTLPSDGSKPLPAHAVSVPNAPQGRVIAFIADLPAGALTRAPDTVVHAGMERYPGTNTMGTLEIGLKLAAKSALRVVPRLAPGSSQDDSSIFIYLESDEKRQKLGALPSCGDIGGFGDMHTGARLLLWAGDLDGDQNLDLVMSFGSNSVTLFLSSFAKGKDFVGEAAAYTQHEPCD